MTIEALCVRVLEAMFFIGLTGCGVVVFLSWVSIFRSGFARK